MSIHYWPPVKPSALAVGTVYTHATSFITNLPVFCSFFEKAKHAGNAETALESKEAKGAGIVYGSSFVGSLAQTYGVSALLNLTGTLTYKGASYLGGLVFLVSTAPTVINNIIVEKKPIDVVLAGIVATLLQTVGLSLTLTWWGTRTNPLAGKFN